jgi:hypothetical protein
MNRMNVIRRIRLLAAAQAALLFSACYFNNSTIHPGAEAFHLVQDSPFFINGNQGITGMAAGGNVVVAVSYEGTIAYSEDNGVHWRTDISTDGGSDGGFTNGFANGFADGIRFNAVTWGEGFFLAGGDGGRAAYSENGRDWFTGVIGPMNPKNIYALAAGKLKNRAVFVAAGNDGRIAYAVGSPRGPWTQVNFSPFGELERIGDAIRALAYGTVDGSGIFVAVGDNGKIGFLNDFSGQVYGATAGTEERFLGVSFGNDRFIAVGSGGMVKICADPKTYNWTTIRESGLGLRRFLDIGFHPAIDCFVLITADSLAGFSENGETWSAAAFTNHFSQGISSLACTKKRIVMGGENGMIAYSN